MKILINIVAIVLTMGYLDYGFCADETGQKPVFPWQSFLNHDSCELVREFVGLVDATHFELHGCQLPEKLIAQTYSAYQTAQETTKLNNHNRDHHTKNAFFPGIFLRMTKSLEDERRRKALKIVNIAHGTRVYFFPSNQYLIWDFINFFKENRSAPSIEESFIAFFKNEYGPHHSQECTTENFTGEELAPEQSKKRDEQFKKDFEQVEIAVRSKLQDIFSRKALASMSDAEILDAAISLFDSLRIRKSTRGNDDLPFDWGQIVVNRGNKLQQQGTISLTGVPSDFTFNLLAGFPDDVCYPLTTYIVDCPGQSCGIKLMINNQVAHYSKESINILLARLTTVLNLVSLTKNFKCISPFTVTLLAAPGKKIMPHEITKENPIEPDSVNSAEASDTGVNIVRHEETIKTIIHEMLHAVDLDKHCKGSNVSRLYFALDETRLHEALVEAMACMLNVIITALEYCHENNRPQDFNEVVTSMWNIERAFGIYQAAKLLVAAGFNRFEDFYNSETYLRVYQTTAAAEYYILKAILLATPTNLFDGILDTYYQSIEEGQTSPLVVALDTILKENRVTMAPYMNEMMNLIRTHGRNGRLGQTARMTIIERSLS